MPTSSIQKLVIASPFSVHRCLDSPFDVFRSLSMPKVISLSLLFRISIRRSPLFTCDPSFNKTLLLRRRRFFSNAIVVAVAVSPLLQLPLLLALPSTLKR
ncbi:hypothetical protein L195_g042860 [Trifolium pratense]|uniref:Uncharacterized protein n=1 Tax=Trifolium pratense TaxID=57577 RepID=A0A2K3M7M4_TRIPR|nr:hypothetical protein L195_g042860 [Trifolium pratense]